MIGSLPAIQKDSPLPLYYQIKQALLGAIQQGNMAPGTVLPGEQELCQYYGVSRPTVRQAMQELTAEGYLERHKGKGTFVAHPKINDRFLNKLQGYNEEMIQKGLLPSTKVLRFERVRRPDIARKLSLAPEEELFCLERVRFANNEPMVYVETYFPSRQFASLSTVDFTRESLYAAMLSRCDVQVSRARREIEAVVANAREIALLGLPHISAVCLVKSVAYDETNTAVEYSIARYRGDRTKFSVELCR